MSRDEQAVSEVLRDQWNPIGLRPGDPRDEYAAYSPRIVAIIRDAGSTEQAATEIASYLTWTRCMTIGVVVAGWTKKDAAVASFLAHFAVGGGP